MTHMKSRSQDYGAAFGGFDDIGRAVQTGSPETRIDAETKLYILTPLMKTRVLPARLVVQSTSGISYVHDYSVVSEADVFRYQWQG